MMTWFKQLVCLLLRGGHRYDVKFHPRPAGRATNVKRVFICRECGKRDDFADFGW